MVALDARFKGRKRGRKGPLAGLPAGYRSAEMLLQRDWASRAASANQVFHCDGRGAGMILPSKVLP